VRGGAGGELGCPFLPPIGTLPPDQRWMGVLLAWGVVAGCGAGYLLWKARQVADAAWSFAAPPVVEARTRGEAKRRRVEAVPEELRGRAAAGGGEGLPGVSVVPASEGEEGEKRATLLGHAQSMKPVVFKQLMEMMW
jgi:hypothetical protein